MTSIGGLIQTRAETAPGAVQLRATPFIVGTIAISLPQAVPQTDRGVLSTLARVTVASHAIPQFFPEKRLAMRTKFHGLSVPHPTRIG